MRQPPPERTLSYVPDAGATLRYALAVPLLMASWTRRSWLLASGLLVSAGWWAFIGVQRHQDDWWLGFALVVAVSVGVFVAYAVAVYVRESKALLRAFGLPSWG